MSTVEENMRLMQTLDIARITPDRETFDNRYADDIEVLWPGQEGPTHSRPAARRFKSQTEMINNRELPRYGSVNDHE